MSTTSARPYVLSLAGFDPSGGAGALADAKTFNALKVHGLIALTANTIQTEDAYLATYWVPYTHFEGQLQALLARYRDIRAVKVGIVPSLAFLGWLGRRMRAALPNAFIVWDPILAPSANEGNAFWEGAGAPALSKKLLAPIDLLTPNLPEFQRLFADASPADTARDYDTSILIKGGHANEGEESLDRLYLKEHPEPLTFAVARSKRGKHGTGCTLSAAIVAYVALGHPLPEACQLAQRFVARYIESSDTLLGFHRS